MTSAVVIRGAEVGLFGEVVNPTSDSHRADGCRCYTRAGGPVYRTVNSADGVVGVSPIRTPPAAELLPS